jgi:hypothetical protein
MMELFSSAALAAVAEKTAETTVLNETSEAVLSEIEESALELPSLADFGYNQETAQRLNQILDERSYKKLNELREISQTNPELIPSYYNDIHTKGQAGEAILEANLSKFGEVNSQVPFGLEGADKGNIVDLQLKDSQSNIKMLELTEDHGQVFTDYNYDIIKGDSASFEVKNGGFPYLRQEVLNGDLLQQIKAGREISDHSFVVINEDTAKALLSSPHGSEVIQMIQEAGGKLIVGLPSEPAQMTLFLS